MKTFTFYSYKGGVGRTLTATNFAVYLAKLGLRVAIVDFDLDAPGVDSKFPDFQMEKDQFGLLDLILEFQHSGDPPNDISRAVCTIPISSPRQENELYLIPAGDYMAPEYAKKLNDLDWGYIFSDQRDGVAYFQLFLRQISEEISPEIVVIDARTGFSEIGGLCTHQLADEAVIISSLASESVKMTKHISRMIRESDVAKALDRKVATKVVVSRTPRPKDIEKRKRNMVELFGVDSKDLFFLFSCPELEREEFVAMLQTEREERLVASYIQLFQGLDVQIAQESINEEIKKAQSVLLDYPDETVAEARIREMVALFPHPEVYRSAMRFFNLRRMYEEAASFGVRLLELSTEDEEATKRVASHFLSSGFDSRRPFAKRHPHLGAISDFDRLLEIAVQAYELQSLDANEKLMLAGILKNHGQPDKAFSIASTCLEEDKVPHAKLKAQFLQIAAECALAAGNNEDAIKYVKRIPTSRLENEIAKFAIELKEAESSAEEALEFAKMLIAKDVSSPVLSAAMSLAQNLNQVDELEEFLNENVDLSELSPEVTWELERAGSFRNLFGFAQRSGRIHRQMEFE